MILYRFIMFLKSPASTPHVFVAWWDIRSIRNQIGPATTTNKPNVSNRYSHICINRSWPQNNFHERPLLCFSQYNGAAMIPAEAQKKRPYIYLFSKCCWSNHLVVAFWEHSFVWLAQRLHEIKRVLTKTRTITIQGIILTGSKCFFWDVDRRQWTRYRYYLTIGWQCYGMISFDMALVYGNIFANIY